MSGMIATEAENFERSIAVSHTYKAVLHGNRVEWIDPPPQGQRAVCVHITLLEAASEDRGKQMADALADLAALGRLSSIIPDPANWQRELRKDTPVPHRES